MDGFERERELARYGADLCLCLGELRREKGLTYKNVTAVAQGKIPKSGTPRTSAGLHYWFSSFEQDNLGYYLSDVISTGKEPDKSILLVYVECLNLSSEERNRVSRLVRSINPNFNFEISEQVFRKKKARTA